MPPEFQEFIAVDWSGSKSPRLHGLQVASCRPGRKVPELVRRKPSWTRTGVMDFVCDRARKNGRVLVGFDFGFAYPFADCGAYFPGYEESPDEIQSTWALIDRLAGDTHDLYAATAARPPSPLAPFFNVHSNRGRWFGNKRLRVTEQRCPTRPSCMFNGVGPASVGVGSLAGMRVLHRLKQMKILRVAIWPFDPIENAELVVVEIFPRLYARTTSVQREQYKTEDEYDAVLSAEAMRSLVKNPKVWSIEGVPQEIIRREGWIFGVG